MKAKGSSDAAEMSQLLVRIATMYYQAHMPQEAIAAQLGMSRQKVQRLLQSALDEGIVEIRIHGSPLVYSELESRLKRAFGLQEVLVAEGVPSPHGQRENVARLAAQYLERSLRDGLTIAIGMGRNTAEIARFFAPSSRIASTFVSAMGGSPKMDSPTNPNEICHLLAASCGGRAVTLYAPAYVESAEMRDRLLQEEIVRSTLDFARQAEMALVGIGGTDDECTLVRSGCFSLEEMRQLRSCSAVGDILGNYFDRRGSLILDNSNGRLVGLTMDDLRGIPNVVAVASETGKSLALLGALRTGVVNVLILDHENAQGILEYMEEDGTL